jgi:hypothetical protein
MRRVYLLFLVLVLVLACDFRGAKIPIMITTAVTAGGGTIHNLRPEQHNNMKTEESSLEINLPDVPKNEDNSYEDITNQLIEWGKEGDGIKKGNGFIEMSSANGRGYNWIISPRLNKPGSYKMVAMVKSMDIRDGGESWEAAKFQIVVYDKRGREIDYKGRDFNGTFDWQPKSVEVYNISGTESIAFRIGLQHATGKALVRDIHIFYKP